MSVKSGDSRAALVTRFRTILDLHVWLVVHDYTRTADLMEDVLTELAAEVVDRDLSPLREDKEAESDAV